MGITIGLQHTLRAVDIVVVVLLQMPEDGPQKR